MCLLSVLVNMWIPLLQSYKKVGFQRLFLPDTFLKGLECGIAITQDQIILVFQCNLMSLYSVVENLPRLKSS